MSRLTVEPRPHESQATPHAIYRQRRRYIAKALATLSGVAFASPALSLGDCEPSADSRPLTETPTPYRDITHYNNYYEFSTDKEAVAVLAQAMTTSPWRISVGGEVENPSTFDVGEILQRWAPVTRVYRFRCVEGWSMVIPWSGVPLCTLLAHARPTAQAKYVRFTSLLRPSEMIGQRSKISALTWPYEEGLRLDEARHPLTLLATGLYDQPLPKQNGAPLRLVVPWKYGYKSIKAVTQITLQAEQPTTSWMRASPSEYGFYANVNPAAPHPRWSQSREVRIGEVKKRRTRMFNGYEQEVAGLYNGMDLEENF